MLPPDNLPPDFTSPPPPNPRAGLPGLRARADERRRLAAEVAPPHLPAEAQQLVRERQVHQLEREMQCKELLLAQAEIQHVWTQYADLYDFAPVAYLTVSAAGLIEQLNLCASQLLGTVRPRLVGRCLAHFVVPESRLAFGQFLARVCSVTSTLSADMELQREDGTRFHVRLEGLRAAGTPEEASHPRCRLVMMDTTAQRAAIAALAASESRFRRLFNDSHDAVVLLRGHTYINCNNAALHLIGASRKEQVVGQHVLACAPVLQPGGQPTAELFQKAVEEARRMGSTRCVAHLHKLSGEVIIVEAVLTAIEEAGETPLVHVLWRDVTERDRLAEEAIRLRLRQQQEVLSAILTTQETERKRMAEALHNGLGQLLYAAKLSLEGRAGNPSAPGTTLRLLHEAIRTTRTISFELTPGILEDFGLQTALQELSNRITPAGLPVRLHLVNLTQRLRPAVEIAVYRIVQELLNNIMKHAQATEVEVHVARENQRLEVSVEDNGRGFEPEALTRLPLAGMGLSGVRNRVALLGGELCIKSRLGRGTIISFALEE